MAKNYRLEVWGAQGGNCVNGAIGGKGGYSIGYKSLSATQKIYLVVGSTGGVGQHSAGGTGGYNGGGKGGDGFSYYNYAGGGGGGGASHIATLSGLLSALSSNKNSIIIVAGGGGGGCHTGLTGFSGGGPSGTTDSRCSPATQTTGYAFGQGQAGRNGDHGSGGGEGNGGGGGGWYGGYVYQNNGIASDCAGGGGSGYIGGVSDGQTTTGVRSSDGYAVITWHPDV